MCHYLCACLLPPVGVLCVRGCGADFFINVLLTLCAYVPGMIHACYIASQGPEHSGGNTVVINNSQMSQRV